MIDTGIYTTSTLPGARPRMHGYVPVFGEKNPPIASPQTFDDALSASVGITESLNTTSAQAAESAAPATNDASTPEETGFLAFLKNIIDIVNPLHHIPVISTLYRHVTGDEIGPMARIAGSGLWGGPIGVLSGMADVVVEQATGKDTGSSLLALFSGDDHNNADNNIQMASHAPLRADDIVWTDSDLSHAPTPTKTHGMSGLKPATYVSPNIEQPVPSQGGIAAVAHGHTNRTEHPGTAQQEAFTTPHLQETPADNAQNEALPPALIATRMMEALEKYETMKQGMGAPLPLYQGGIEHLAF